MSLPHFTYHPDPLATGMIEKKDAICPCCEGKTEYVYVGIPYCVEEIENLCPDCIASGKAAEKFGAEFCDNVPLVRAGLRSEIVDEVVFRTPGFFSWQQEKWLACCDDACEFHGNLECEEFRNLSSENVQRFRGEHPYIDDRLWNDLLLNYQPKGNVGIYKFVCRHCRRIRLGFDFD
jgi:uncharacterized protein CbrC (UPF0167 family)